MNNQRKVLIGLFIVVCIAALWVIKEAPLLIRGDVGGVKIGQGWSDYFFIRGDELNCAADPASQRTTCKTMLDGSLLHATFTTPEHGIRAGDFCEVEYNGATTTCSANYAIFNTTRFGIYVDDHLGISPEQMAAIRSQHPFLYYPESRWINGAAAAVVLLTILVILFFWNTPIKKYSGQNFLRLLKWSAASAVLLGLLWFSSIVGLIALGYVD